MKRLYKVSMNCQNCRMSEDIEIPKGTKVEKFIKDNIINCTNCECRIINSR